MSKKAQGQVRRSQVITTYGPGALIDLPKHSAIVAGLDSWPKQAELDEVVEPRLSRKLANMMGLPLPRLYAPPPDEAELGQSPKGIGAWRFPEWFVVREGGGEGAASRSRRLVHRKQLDDKWRFEGKSVVATRFVRACPRGHVDDLDWRHFAHRGDDGCRRQLWLDESGTTGDLFDLTVRCECGKRRGLFEAKQIEETPLGVCSGARLWLGLRANEACAHPSRLLIRTASNAYFPQVIGVLSLPNRASAVEAAVRAHFSMLQAVETEAELAVFKKLPAIAAALQSLPDADVLKAIHALKSGQGEEPPVKQAELEALISVPEGFGDDVPVDPDFHARRLPDVAWRSAGRFDAVGAVVQAHRLREVMALIGFTRLDAVTPDINGEYDTDVERADLALQPSWFPAVENRGEGVFLQLRAEAVEAWLQREAVRARLEGLAAGHQRWADKRKSARPFPGGPYVLLHTLSHLLLQSLAMRCGYPASSIRERIYADEGLKGYGVLLYTGTPDAEGTLGGLVSQARHVEEHLAQALRMASLCSNDPICAQHEPGVSLEGRWLHGAACHACALVAETSCEMRNDYLDRALVVPTVGVADAAFFGVVP